MMGSFLSRALLLVFGYAYPAYECFKSVEKIKPEIEQLLFWCRYWIIVAMLTVCERVGDAFISWLPLYNEAKLAFFMYLWHPKTKGTTYVYNSFFRPYVAKHETEIDRNLLELRVKAENIATVYWKRGLNYAQLWFFQILQYVSSQSAALPYTNQPKRSLSDSSIFSTQQQHEQGKQIKISDQSEAEAEAEASNQATASEKEAKGGDADSSQQKTIGKEAIRLTRGKWKIFQTAINN